VKFAISMPRCGKSKSHQLSAKPRWMLSHHLFQSLPQLNMNIRLYWEGCKWSKI
jgi:hypothetical protein